MSEPVDEFAAARAEQRLEGIALAHPEMRVEPSAENAAAWLDVLDADAKGTDDMAKDAKVQVAFRLPAKLVKRIDDHVRRMDAASPGLEYSRADAVRTLLTRALDEVEAAAAAPRSRK